MTRLFANNVKRSQYISQVNTKEFEGIINQEIMPIPVNDTHSIRRYHVHPIRQSIISINERYVYNLIRAAHCNDHLQSKKKLKDIQGSLEPVQVNSIFGYDYYEANKTIQRFWLRKQETDLSRKANLHLLNRTHRV